MKNLITTLILTFIISVSNATDYYVKNGGSDVADGLTDGTAWATIAKVNATSFAAGDVIHFKRGSIWNEVLTPPTSGTSGSRITYTDYGSGALPKISPTETLTSWTSVGSGNWKATINLEQNLPWLDGILGNDALFYVTIDGNLTYQGRGAFRTTMSSTTSSTLTDVFFAGKDYTGAEVISFVLSYTPAVAFITAHSGSTLTYSSNWSLGTNKYFLQNHVEFLDSIGKWMYNRSTKELTMNFGADNPNTHVIKTALKSASINFDGRSYLTFSNLDLSGANWSGMYFINSTNILIDGIEVKGGMNGVYANFSANNKITVQNSKFTRTEESGVHAYEADSTVVNNNTFDSIALNLTSAKRFGGASAIALSLLLGDNSSATNNTLNNLGYIGIASYGSQNIIEDNKVDSFGINREDCGGIYCYGMITGKTYLPFTYVRRNVVSNGIGHDVHGIYLDDKSNNVFLEDNSVYNTTGAGIFLHNNQNIEIHDNTVFNAKEMMWIADDAIAGGFPTTGLNITNNTFILKDESQFALYIQSVETGADMAPTIGIIDSNTYASPLGQLRIKNVYPTASPIAKEMSLKEFRSVYGFELNGSVSPVKKKPYTITTLGTQHHTNSLANVNSGFGNGANSNTTIALDTELDGSAFKMSYASPVAATRWSAAYWDLAANASGLTRYLIKGSIKAAHPLGMYVALSNSSTDFIDDLPYSFFEADSIRTEFEILNPTGIFAGYGKLLIRPIDETRTPVWIDNLEVYPVAVTEISPSSFYYAPLVNTGNDDTTFTLAQPIKDVATGTVYTTSVVVPANSMIVAMDTTGSIAVKTDQTITFASLSSKLTTDAPFTLSATSTSGLTVSFASSNTSVVTISGNTATIVGAGTSNITASQAGNDTYNPASNVVRTQTVTSPETQEEGTRVNLHWTLVETPTPTEEEPNTAISTYANTEEFTVFDSWRNFRTAYGITGKTNNITAQLQSAVDSMGVGTYSKVLYLPTNNGDTAIYEIDETIFREGGDKLYITGEDPYKVIFKWVGDSSGVMFDFDGVHYSRPIQRATLDGTGRKGTLVRQAWNGTGTNGRSADTGNEYADLIFKNAAFGLVLGDRGNYGAEVAIMRCRFENIKNNGNGIAVWTANFNSLDVWAWHSTFTDCDRGMSNNNEGAGAGSFHAFGSNFINNTYAFNPQATEQFSIRESNFISRNKVDGHYPIVSGFNVPNSAQYVVQKNRFTGAHAAYGVGVNQWSTIYVGNNGNLVSLDNKFHTYPDPAGPNYVEGAFRFGGSASISSIGDSTNRDNGFVQNLPVDSIVKYKIEYDLSTAWAVDSSLPAAIPFLSKANRTIYKVTTAMNNAQAQSKVDSAVAEGNRAIVQFNNGTFSVGNLSIPANANIQIAGDGHSSYLAGTTFNITGPTKVTIRDLQCTGGISMTNVNQDSSRIYFHQLEFFNNHTKGIEITGIEIPVYFINSGFGYANTTAFKLNGGTGTTYVLASQGMANSTHFDVTNAKLYVGSYWAEKNPDTAAFIWAKGGAQITWAGGRLAPPDYTGNNETVRISGNNNQFTMFGVNLNNVVKVDGTGTNTKVLLQDNLLAAPYIVDSSASADIRLIHPTEKAGAGSGYLGTDRGERNEAFIKSMFIQGRSLVLPQLDEKPDSDIRILRVKIEGSTNGIIIN